MGEQAKEEVSMYGYLEKKGGLKLMPAWKQYWFVLKDQLLLYYRSQLDYLNLSVHKGSINMGLASNVRPGLSRPNIIEIVTPTQIITLRAKDRSIQEQWLQVMLESMAALKTVRTSTAPMHIRYSLDNLPTITNDVQTVNSNDNVSTSVGNKENILARISRLGGRSYGAGSFESVIPRHDLPYQAIEDAKNNRVEEDKRVSQDSSKEYDVTENKLYHRQQSEVQNVSSDSAAAINVIEYEECEVYEQLSPERLKNPSKCEHKDSEIAENEWYTTEAIQRNMLPELPSMPIPGSNQLFSDAEEDVIYAECYEDIGHNENKETSGKGNSKTKKKNSMKSKDKRKVPKHEITDKEKSNKNKKNGFFMSVFGHYRKKADSENSNNTLIQKTEESALNYTYDSVECAPTVPVEVLEAKDMKVSPAKCKLSLLPSNALTELQLKLKLYDNQKVTEETAKLGNEVKSNGIKDELSDKSAESNPPSLPPRQSGEKRPSSPWHDIPTNNLPVDVDANKMILSQEQQDSLLGTPQGFALLKSKWKAAESGGEWNPELHRLQLLPSTTEDATEDDSISVQTISQLYSKVDKNPKATINKVDSHEVDSHEVNLKPEEEKLISQISINDFAVSKRLSVTSNSVLKMNEDVTKNSTDESFQQDSLMSCVLNEKEHIIPHSFLQDNILISNMTLQTKNDKCGKDLSNRDSNDLNILLAQLAEITTAPLLTPGATTSLVNYPHSDMHDQLALLGPIRRRRYSEPDYDIPRPHRPLLLRPVCDAERLQCVDKEMNEDHLPEDAVSCNLSISPDSLEPVPSHREDNFCDGQQTT